MADESTRRTEEQTNPQQNQPAQVKRPAGTTPSLPREEPVRTSISGKTCEVLKDSCKEPADWVAKTPDGVEIYVCDEHKPLVAINYPDVQFEYEEV